MVRNIWKDTGGNPSGSPWEQLEFVVLGARSMVSMLRLLRIKNLVYLSPLGKLGQS